MHASGNNSILSFCVSDSNDGATATGVEKSSFKACTNDANEIPIYVQVLHDEEGVFIEYIITFLDGSGIVIPTTDATLFKDCPTESSTIKVIEETVRLDASLTVDAIARRPAYPGYAAIPGQAGNKFTLTGEYKSYQVIPSIETPDLSVLKKDGINYRIGCGPIVGASLPGAQSSSGGIFCHDIVFEAVDGGFFEILITRLA